ncbi:MAG: lipid asymmetry maintenance protein MlaB, partial [Burkholderiales bacterium]
MVEYKLTGTLVIETVNRQLATLAKLIGSSKQVQLDLAEIRIIDSAGVALLIEIKQLAQHKQC